MKQFPFLALVFLLFASSFSFGQVAQEEMKRQLFGNPLSDYNQNSIRSMSRMHRNSFEKYYLFDDWAALTVFGKDGQNLVIDSSNYLIAESELLFKKDGELQRIYPQYVDSIIIGGKMINGVMFGSKTMKPFYDSSNDKPYSFYEVLATGKMSLLKSYEVKEKNVSTNPMGIKDTEEVTVTQIATYHYINRKAEIVQLPKRKKDIMELFKHGRNALISFAKESDLNPKKEADLIRLFNFSNDWRNEKM